MCTIIIWYLLRGSAGWWICVVGTLSVLLHVGSFGTGLGTGWYMSLIYGSSPSKIYFELGTTGLIEDDPLSSCSVISSDNVLSLLSA